MIYFYKDSNDLFHLNDKIIPAGNYILELYSNNTEITIKSKGSAKIILSTTLITNLYKENSTAYTNIIELLTNIGDLFKGSSGESSNNTSTYKIESTSKNSFASFENSGADEFLTIQANNYEAATFEENQTSINNFTKFKGLPSGGSGNISEWYDSNAVKVAEISDEGNLNLYLSSYKIGAIFTERIGNARALHYESFDSSGGYGSCHIFRKNGINIAAIGARGNNYKSIWGETATYDTGAIRPSIMNIASEKALLLHNNDVVELNLATVYFGSGTPSVGLGIKGTTYSNYLQRLSFGSNILNAGVATPEYSFHILQANHGFGIDIPTEKLDITETTKTQGRRDEITSITDNYITTKSDYTIEINASSNTVEVELLEPNTDNNGQRFEIDVYNATNTITVIAYSNVLFDVDTITDQGSNIWRYTMTGLVDLSNISVGDKVKITNATNAANDGYFVVTAVNNGSDYIEVTNASGVAETSSPCTIQETVYKDTTLIVNDKKFYRAYENRNTYKKFNLS